MGEFPAQITWLPRIAAHDLCEVFGGWEDLLFLAFLNLNVIAVKQFLNVFIPSPSKLIYDVAIESRCSLRHCGLLITDHTINFRTFERHLK